MSRCVCHEVWLQPWKREQKTWAFQINAPVQQFIPFAKDLQWFLDYTLKRGKLRKKKKRKSFLKPPSCSSIIPLFIHIWGEKLPLLHHCSTVTQLSWSWQLFLQRLHCCCQPVNGCEELGKVRKYETAGPHTTHQESTFVFEKEEETRD